MCAYRKMSLFFLLSASVILLLASGLMAQPEYNVTLDSVFEVSADDVGEETLFHARPRVYVIAGGTKVNAKVLNKPAEFADGLTTIRCQWSRVIAPKTYSLYVLLAEKNAPVEVTAKFNVNGAIIDEVSSEWEVAGNTVTVRGRFFSSRPTKVELITPGGKDRSLQILKPYRYPNAEGVPAKSVMELESAVSELSFLVPKNFGDPVPAVLRICNSIGAAEIPFYPNKYDLRDHHLITPVKNQCGLRPDGISDVGSSVGLCWAFASLSSFGSSLLKQGYQTDPEADGANLSPWYLGNYIEYNGHPLEFNSDLWLDPIELEPATNYGYFKPDQKGWGGGGGHWVCDYINSGNSVVLWKDAPMPNEKMTLHENLLKPDPLPSCGYMVKDMFLFQPEDFGSLDEFRFAIKKAILELGAIQSYIHLDAVDCGGIEKQTDKRKDPVEIFIGHRFMDKENHNYFCYDEKFTGDLTHAVSIAGWDNTREIDIDGHSAKGAWLIKDSSGENNHGQGYFWVAFDDAVFLKRDSFATAFKAHPGTGYKSPALYQTHAGALTPDESGFYWYR